MMIVVNFKEYKRGEESLGLAKTIERLLPEAIVCVLKEDIELVSKGTRLRVFGQQVENVGEFRALGGVGSLINHSDHPVSNVEIEKVLGESNGFDVIVCAESLKRIKEIAGFGLKPFAIAFEVPELIGTGKSITSYNAKDVKEFVRLLKESGIKAFCGAGISSVEDVKAAYGLGCTGVLIASAIAKGEAKKAEKLLKELSEIKR